MKYIRDFIIVKAIAFKIKQSVISRFVIVIIIFLCATMLFLNKDIQKLWKARYCYLGENNTPLY